MAVKKPKKLVENKSKVEKAPEVAGLQSLVNSLNKKFGKNAVMIGVPKFGEEDASGESFSDYPALERVSTGCLSLDVDLGGGLPLGRYIEVSGAYSCTKTTLCAHTLANAQKKGLVCALLDVEGTSDKEYLTKVGVDVESLLYLRPASLEELLQVMLDIQRSGIVKFVVWDSVAQSLSAAGELNAQIGDSGRMNVPQTEIGSFLRQWNMTNNRFYREGSRPFTVLAVNQIRERPMAMGNPEYSPGGRSRGFASSVEIKLRKGDWIKEGTGTNQEIVGQVVKYMIEKNKCGKRMVTGETDFYYDCPNQAGVPPLHYDTLKELILLGVDYEVISKSGSWFAYKDITKIQGVSSLVDALKARPDYMDDIRSEIMTISARVSSISPPKVVE